MIIRASCILLLMSMPANVQFAMPMYPAPQPMFAVPPPMFVAISSCEQTTRTTTTTTTTTPRAIAVAVPVPVPLPVQMAIPAYPAPSFCYSQPRPKGCPPCPPCQCQPACTPSFFSYCSPCHLKCRCRNGDSVPVPLPPMAPQPIAGPAYPIPAPVPPNLIVVPFPPMMRPVQGRQDTDSESESESSSDDSCSDGKYYLRQGHNNNKKHQRKGKHGHKGKEHGAKQRKHRKKGRKGPKVKRNFNNVRLMNRRYFDSSDSENRLVKPVLSYIASDGEVKLQKGISAVDAAKLMSDQEDVQTINVQVQENIYGQPQSLMISSDYNEPKEISKNTRRLKLRQKNEPYTLHRGRKELYFKPPNDKRITNLSLSFQIT